VTGTARRQAGQCRFENISRDGVDAAVVFVQHGNRDKPGPVLEAAYTSLN
jgi:hypothetical protein